MATRPVFLPIATNYSPTREIPIEFTWHAGMSVSQKQKSIASLHEEARKRLNLHRILEVSTKSTEELGRRLSAFNMRVALKNGGTASVESAYQSSKVFSGGGPFIELLRMDSRIAKTDERLRSSGSLLRFQFEDITWALEPPTAFYDWLYITALAADADLTSAVQTFDGFTDIEFNPERSLNCQARSVALFCSLSKSGELQCALSSPASFIDVLRRKPPGTDQGNLF